MPPIQALARRMGAIFARPRPAMAEAIGIPFGLPPIGRRLAEIHERWLELQPPEVRRRREAERAVHRWVLHGEGDPERVREHAAFLREQRLRRNWDEPYYHYYSPRMERFPIEPLIHHRPPREMWDRLPYEPLIHPRWPDRPLIHPRPPLEPEWGEMRINARKIRRPRRLIHHAF